jgi:hypothetical protein
MATTTAALPPASTSSASSTATAATAASQSRPLDQLGPPSEPISFPRPQLLRGRRGTVLCYNSTTKEHEVLNNVLFRDFGRGAGSGGTVRHAYWKIPYKEPIQTIMGHVEMCRVLDRSTRQHDDDSSCEAEDGDNYDTDDEDDEIVFEWTDKCVAVKVNYTDCAINMPKMKEIAAMQLLGEEPLHVL